MTAIAILQFSPVPAYFCCGWVKSPIREFIEAGYIVYPTTKSKNLRLSRTNLNLRGRLVGDL